MECSKKALKKQANRVALGIFLYNLILYLVVFLDIIIKCAQLLLNDQSGPQLEQKFEELGNSIMHYGGSSTAGVLAGLVFLLVYFRKDRQLYPIFISGRKPALSDLLQILLVFLSGQFLFSLFSAGMESIVNLLGYSMISDIEAATGGSSTIFMFLYVSLFGPVAEELVYRGFVLRRLERYGRVFAIIVSSVLFGVMHANFTQGVFAFYVGVILAYVTLEYSIHWAILLHILNNAVMSELWSRAMSYFPDTVQIVLSWGVMSLFFIGGCLVLWKNRRAISDYRTALPVDKRYYRYAFTAFWMILFLVSCLLLSVMGIEKIG